MNLKISVLIACGLLFTTSFAFPQSAGSDAASVGSARDQAKINVLVVYYSVSGNTGKMAKAVVEGAQKIPGAQAIAKPIDQVIESDLKTADALVLGSPTYYGNMAGPMKSFIDDWWLKYKINLTEKVGGAFATGGSATGGKELVIHSLIASMLNAGMIIAGPLEGPFGLAGATAQDPVNEAGLKEAEALGERVAKVALRLRN